MENSSLANLILPLALFVIMLGVGMTLRLADFKMVLGNPKAVLAGVIGQLVLLPLLGWMIVSLFSLPAVYSVGLMILCFAPGGATSNMLTLLARGDTALSVTLTAISGLIIPFSLPVLTYLSLHHWMGEEAALEFPVLKSIAQILVIALLPALLGMLISSRCPKLASAAQKPVKLISILFMVMVVVGLVRANGESLAAQLSLLAGPVLLLSSLAIMLGFLLGQLTGQDRSRQCALGIEIGIQNAGTAILVSGSLLHNAEMALTALTYGVLMNLPAFLLLAVRNADLFVWRRLSGAR